MAKSKSVVRPSTTAAAGSPFDDQHGAALPRAPRATPGPPTTWTRSPGCHQRGRGLRRRHHVTPGRDGHPLEHVLHLGHGGRGVVGHEQHPLAGRPQAGHAPRPSRGWASPASQTTPSRSNTMATSGDPPHALCQPEPVARFEPFRGIRYDPARVDLGAVTAPPYDVLSESDRDQLAGRDPHNIVRIDVPLERHGPGRYDTAAATLHRWLDEGVLVTDVEPSFYLRADDVRRRVRHAARNTVGVLGALEVVDPGKGEVLPHERTTPKARTDRLDLTRATEANLSAIWGLSLAAGLSSVLAEPGEPIGELVDDAGRAPHVRAPRRPDPHGRRGDGRRRRAGGHRRRPPSLRGGPHLPGRAAGAHGRRARSLGPHAGLHRRAGRGAARRPGHPPAPGRAAGRLRPGAGTRCRGSRSPVPSP